MTPPRFRIPPLITTLSEGMLYGCRYGMISLELPEGMTELADESLGACRSLRNLALPHDPILFLLPQPHFRGVQI